MRRGEQHCESRKERDLGKKRKRDTSYVPAFRDELTKKEGAHTRLSLPARTSSNALLKKAKGDEGAMGPNAGEEREFARDCV